MAESQIHLNTAEPQNPQHSSHTVHFSIQQPQILLNTAALHILPTQQPLRFLLNKAAPQNPPQYGNSSESISTLHPLRILYNSPSYPSQWGSYSESSAPQPLRILLNTATPQNIFNVAGPQNSYQYSSPSELCSTWQHLRMLVNTTRSQILPNTATPKNLQNMQVQRFLLNRSAPPQHGSTWDSYQHKSPHNLFHTAATQNSQHSNP